MERDVRAYLDAQAAPPQREKEAPPITPVARHMAEEAGLDWRSLRGSGPGGRITRDDVVGVLERAPIEPEPKPTPAEINEALDQCVSLALSVINGEINADELVDIYMLIQYYTASKSGPQCCTDYFIIILACTKKSFA